MFSHSYRAVRDIVWKRAMRDFKVNESKTFSILSSVCFFYKINQGLPLLRFVSLELYTNDCLKLRTHFTSSIHSAEGDFSEMAARRSWVRQLFYCKAELYSSGMFVTAKGFVSSVELKGFVCELKGGKEKR